MSAAEKATPEGRGGTGKRSGDLLARFAADARTLAAERRLLPAGAEARLGFLLREIDENMLPRLMRLFCAGREVARLTVSQRSLIALDMPGRPAMPEDAADLVDICAPRLIELANLRGDLSLQVERRPAQPSRALAACSVPSLTLAVALSSSQSAYDRLLRQAEARSFARLSWSEANPAAQFAGAPEWKALLATVADAHRGLRQAQGSGARFAPSQLDGLAVPVSEDKLLVIASVQGKGFAVILPSQSGLDMIAAWQSH